MMPKNFALGYQRLMQTPVKPSPWPMESVTLDDERGRLGTVRRTSGTSCTLFMVLVISVLGLQWSMGCATSSVNQTRAHQAMVDIGHQELKEGRPIEALKHLERVLAEDGKNSTAHELTGLAYLQLGRMNKAQPHLEAAIRYDDKNSNAKNTLAVVLLQLGQCARSSELLKQVADDVYYVKQDYVEHNLAQAEACLGRVDAALRRLSKLTRTRSKFCLAYLTMSEIAITSRRYEETVEACESFRDYCVRDQDVGASVPDDLKATCDLRKGRAYAAIGDIESARTALSRCSLAEVTKKPCREALQRLPP